MKCSSFECPVSDYPSFLFLKVQGVSQCPVSAPSPGDHPAQQQPGGIHRPRAAEGDGKAGNSGPTEQ